MPLARLRRPRCKPSTRACACQHARPHTYPRVRRSDGQNQKKQDCHRIDAAGAGAIGSIGLPWGWFPLPLFTHPPHTLQAAQAAKGGVSLPWGLALLFSVFVAIAATGSIFEYQAGNPIFGLITVRARVGAPPPACLRSCAGG